MKVTINTGVLKPGDENMLVSRAFPTVEIPEGENSFIVSGIDLVTLFSDVVRDKPEKYLVEDIIFHFVIED